MGVDITELGEFDDIERHSRVVASKPEVRRRPSENKQNNKGMLKLQAGKAQEGWRTKLSRVGCIYPVFAKHGTCGCMVVQQYRCSSDCAPCLLTSGNARFLFPIRCRDRQK